MMDNVYIEYKATIMPNVKIDEHVIIGAGVLISKCLEANGVYVGIPIKKYVVFMTMLISIKKFLGGRVFILLCGT